TILAEMSHIADTFCLTLALYCIDASHIELSVAAFFPDCPGSAFRNDAELRHGVGGVRLDLEPDAKSRCRLPDGRHFRPAVTRNHRSIGFMRCTTAPL